MIKYYIFNKKIFYLIFILTVNIIFFLSFYPGFFTPDSFDILNQSFFYKNINDAHPILFTLIVSLINFFLKAPYSFIIIQIILFSLTFYFLFNKFKLDKGIEIVLLFLISFYPPFLFMNITFWKDVLYTISFFNFVLIIYFYFNEKIKINKRISILILFLIFIVLSSRHNGIHSILLFLIFTSILKLSINYKKNLFIILKIWIYFFISFLIFFSLKNYFLKKYQINSYINKNFLSDNLKFQIYFFSIPYYLKNYKNNNINSDSLNKIIPISILDDIKFYPYIPDEIIYNDKFNSKMIDKNIKLINKNFLNYLKDNPNEFLIYFIKNRSFIINPIPFKDEFVFKLRSAPQKIHSLPKEVCINFCNLKTSPKIKKLNLFFNKLYEVSFNNSFLILIWRPAFYLFLSIIIFIIILKKTNKLESIMFILASISNFLPFSLLITSPDFRYYYINVFVLFFYLFLFFHKDKKLTQNKF